ncbi:cytochrome c [Aquifex pyrophilus]
MRKVFFFALLPLTIFAAEKDELFKKGYEVYKRSCSACHVEYMSPQEIRKIRMTVMRGGKPPISAPPMNEVSARVKHFYPNELEFVEFVKDYITNPSREKGVCMPMAFKLFGVMPPIGKTLTEEEKEAVAYWLYHRYKETWRGMKREMMGDMKGKMMGR